MYLGQLDRRRNIDYWKRQNWKVLEKWFFLWLKQFYSILKSKNLFLFGWYLNYITFRGLQLIVLVWKFHFSLASQLAARVQHFMRSIRCDLKRSYIFQSFHLICIWIHQFYQFLYKQDYFSVFFINSRASLLQKSS